MLNMKSKIFKYIYAMLCLLPAIAVGVTCVYVANNDNAYQSYSGSVLESTDTYIATPKYNSNNVSTFEDIVIGNIYSFDFSAYNQNYWFANQDDIVEFEILSGDVSSTPNDVYLDDNATPYYDTKISMSLRLGTFELNLFNGDGSVIASYDVGSPFDAPSTIVVFCTFISKSHLQYGDISNCLGYTDYQEYTYTPYEFNNTSLDNVFYYSLDKVENSSVFSWVKSNFLYSGVNQFVGIFGGTNSNISFYLTWVLTISLCYLGFEVLMLFINMARNLIHSFTDKDRW